MRVRREGGGWFASQRNYNSINHGSKEFNFQNFEIIFPPHNFLCAEREKNEHKSRKDLITFRVEN
jgi:hypothetical protein